MSNLIELKNLTKRYGTVLAVDDISLTVKQGEVLGFLGPNGAGKSTTMKMATGFVAPTAGTALICGHDILDDTIAAQKRIGYLPEGAPLYSDMSASGLLDFVAAIRGLQGTQRRARLDWVIDKCNLGEVLYDPIDNLSKGFKRRVGLAQALIHDPDVLILDEPTDGLDPNQKLEVRRLIEEMAKDKAIVISTHILEEVEAVCTRAVVIARGKVVADGTPAKLQARSRYHNSVRIQLENRQTAAIRKLLLSQESIIEVEDNGSRGGRATITVIASEGQSITDTVHDLAKANKWPVASMAVNQGRLDDVFNQITMPQG